jgi:hypothetical protein
MILNKRNSTKTKNMLVQVENNNSVQIFNQNTNENVLIATKSSNKKSHKQISLSNAIINSVSNFNPTNVNENLNVNILKKKVPNVHRNDRSSPAWFDWNYYLNIHADLRNAGIETEKDAYEHWQMHGEKEGRECMKNHSLFKQYPNLFHKYLLGLSNSEEAITYNVENEINITKKYICSIHCYNLVNFKKYFEQYLKPLSVLFDFVVTYVEDIRNVRFEYNFIFIKMKNKGMDIGSKFVTINYLKNKNVDYSYVFFIHSKSNTAFREKYMKFFIINLNEIASYMDSNKHYGIFNSLIHNYGGWGQNYIYMNEIVDYFDFNKNYFSFPEGNFYILHKEICEYLFTDLKIYNILNKSNDFDYTWVKNYYNLNGNYKDVHNIYVSKKLYGNNIETKLGHSGLADCMIEHIFERIVFLALLKCNKPFHVMESRALKKRSENLTMCAIACHSNNSMKIKTIVNNIHYLNEISDLIYIIDTDSFKNNELIKSIQSAYPDACINYELTDEKTREYIKEHPDLFNMTLHEAKEHFKMFGFKESHRLCIFSHFIFVSYCENYGYCYGKWLHFLNNMEKNVLYKNYILTNDSFLITNKLDKFNELIQENKYELISLTASNQINYHYTDFLRSYNCDAVYKYKNFIEKELSRSTDFAQVICNIEVPSVHLFSLISCVYEAETGYNGNINFDNDKLFHYLNDLAYPIVKIKKINSQFYSDNVVPEDFNGEIYKSLHPDLINIPDPMEHFIHCGIPEGRLYKPNQIISMHMELKKYLLDYVSQNTNICKIDFENYTT